MAQFLTLNDPDFVVLQSTVTYIHTKLQKGLTKTKAPDRKIVFFPLLLLAAVT